MVRLIFLLMLALSAGANAFIDDRLRNISPVIEQIDKGVKIDPIKVDLENYIYVLNIKSLRKKLKPHMVVVLENGKVLKPANGVLTTKITVPFNKLIRMYQYAYAGNKKETIKFLKTNTKPQAIDIENVLTRYSIYAPFSQKSIKKMLKGFGLKSLAKKRHAISLLELYFAVGGVVNNPNNKELYAYKKNDSYCFLSPPAASTCIEDKELSRGIKKSLSAHVGLGVYKSKQDFNKNTFWRVVY